MSSWHPGCDALADHDVGVLCCCLAEMTSQLPMRHCCVGAQQLVQAQP
jgi:hypothetical protein